MDLLQKQKTQSIIKKMDSWVQETIEAKELPTKPDLMLQLLQLTSDVNTFSSEVVDALAQNQVLAQSIIKNAKLKSIGGQVNSRQLQQSIQRLGYEFVQAEVEIDCLKRFAKCLRPLNKRDLMDDLRQSLRVAFIAQEIARKVEGEKSEHAFFAGLMHNIGKIIIGLRDSRSYEEIQKMSKRGMEEKAAELILLGFEHYELSAKMVEGWQLPSRVAAVVRYHEHLSQVKEDDKKLAVILKLSVYIAKALNDKSKTPLELYRKTRDIFKNLGIEAKEEVMAEEIKQTFIKILSYEDRVFMQI